MRSSKFLCTLVSCIVAVWIFARTSCALGGEAPDTKEMEKFLDSTIIVRLGVVDLGDLTVKKFVACLQARSEETISPWEKSEGGYMLRINKVLTLMVNYDKQRNVSLLSLLHKGEQAGWEQTLETVSGIVKTGDKILKQRELKKPIQMSELKDSEKITHPFLAELYIGRLLKRLENGAEIEGEKDLPPHKRQEFREKIAAEFKQQQSKRAVKEPEFLLVLLTPPRYIESDARKAEKSYFSLATPRWYTTWSADRDKADGVALICGSSRIPIDVVNLDLVIQYSPQEADKVGDIFRKWGEENKKGKKVTGCFIKVRGVIEYESIPYETRVRFQGFDFRLSNAVITGGPIFVLEGEKRDADPKFDELIHKASPATGVEGGKKEAPSTQQPGTNTKNTEEKAP